MSIIITVYSSFEYSFHCVEIKATWNALNSVAEERIYDCYLWLLLFIINLNNFKYKTK